MDDKNFDKISAEDWTKSIELKGSQVRSKDVYPLINEWLKNNSIKKLVDLGCGQGDLLKYIKNSDVKYTGYDASEFLIKRAKENLPSHKDQFILGNVYGLPCNENEFDGVVSIALWHLLHDIKMAFQEVSRILKKNGNFIIFTLHPDSYDKLKTNYQSYEIKNKIFKGINVFANGDTVVDTLYFHTLDDIKEALSSANLKLLKNQKIRDYIVLFGEQI